MSSDKRTWSNAIQAWYNEVKDFRYGVGSVNGGVVGHYTQVQLYSQFVHLYRWIILTHSHENWPLSAWKIQYCYKTGMSSALLYLVSLHRLFGTILTRLAVLWPTVPTLNSSTSTSATTADRKDFAHLTSPLPKKTACCPTLNERT